MNKIRLTREEVEARWTATLEKKQTREEILGTLTVIYRAYLAQEEELKGWQRMNRDMEECVDNVREAMGLESTHFLILHDNVREMRLERDKLKAENQALRDQVSVIKRAIIDEPELPGPMPEGMIETIATVGIEEVLRVVVRETKKGILWRANL